MHNRNRRCGLIALLAFTAGSCGAVKFDVDQDLDMQTVPGNALGGVLGTFVANPFKLNIDLKAEVAKRGTGPAKSAQLSVVPRSATTLTFDITPDVDLLPYVNAGATISATAVGTSPPQDTRFDGHVQIEVRI